MKKIFFLIVVFTTLAIFTNEIPAQEKFHISVNAGYTFPIGGGEYYSNLKGGNNLNLKFSYSFVSAIEITGSFGYTYIPLRNYSYVGVMPAALFKSSTVYPMNNINPDFYQTSLGIRIINPIAKIKPFLAVETGLYFMYKNMNGYFSSGGAATQSIYEKFFGIGFGFIVPLNAQLGLTVEGRYESTFTGSQSFFPAMFGVRYNF